MPPKLPNASREQRVVDSGLFGPRRHARRDRRTKTVRQRLGAAMVEFAIVANIVILSVFSCMEFARMNMVRNLSQDAAYAAVRHAIVPGATSAEAIAKANEVMESLLTTGYTVSVGAINQESSQVVVTVTVDLNQVALFTPMFFRNKTIVSRATLRTERYDGFFQQ